MGGRACDARARTEVAMHDAAFASGERRVQVEQRIRRLGEDAQPLLPAQRTRRGVQPEAAQVLRLRVVWPQPVGEAAAAHQREDEARAAKVEVVAEQRQHVRMVARLQHRQLARPAVDVVHACLGALHRHRPAAQRRRTA